MKREVVNLGEIPPWGFDGRDAVHISCIPVTVMERMVPGTKVKIDKGSMGELVAYPADLNNYDDYVGVIDPFYNEDFVDSGTRAWLLLRPKSIVELRHVWVHPEIDWACNKLEAEDYLCQCAVKLDMSYESLLEIASNFLRSGNSYVEYGGETLRYKFFSDIDSRRFWWCVCKLTGLHLPEDMEMNPFDCSC